MKFLSRNYIALKKGQIAYLIHIVVPMNLKKNQYSFHYDVYMYDFADPERLERFQGVISNNNETTNIVVIIISWLICNSVFKMSYLS